MAKVRYQAKRGNRIKKSGFVGLTPIRSNIWWSDDENRWARPSEFDECSSFESYNMNVHSVKAAIRHINKHNEIPVGTEFMLSSRWIGYDVYITKK